MGRALALMALHRRPGVVKTSVADTSNPPTDAELDSAFGTPQMVGKGFVGLLNDGGSGSNVYLIASDGTNWWHVLLTKAV